jgi:predicted SnoaL-like aldol condensation-catalyzing enzyme
MTAKQNKAAAVRALEDLNGTERERFFALYAPDVELHGYPLGITTLDELRAYYAELWETYPDARVEVIDAVAETDFVAVRFIWHGGDVSAPGLLLLRFDDDGRVVERWQESSELAVLRAAALVG